MARALGGQMIFLQGDLTRDEDIERSVAEASKLGQIRYLVNIAGIQHIDSIENFPMAKFDFMMRLMIRAPFYLCKLAMPYMRKSQDGCGAIGNMASIHAHISTLNKPGLQHHEICHAGARPVRRRRVRVRSAPFP